MTPFVTGAGMPNYMVFQSVSATPLPIVVTGVASEIGDTTATLNGTVNPSGSDTTYQFEYRLDNRLRQHHSDDECRKRVYSGAGECGSDWSDPRNGVSLPRHGHQYWRNS